MLPRPYLKRTAVIIQIRIRQKPQLPSCTITSYQQYVLINVTIACVTLSFTWPVKAEYKYFSPVEKCINQFILENSSISYCCFYARTHFLARTCEMLCFGVQNAVRVPVVKKAVIVVGQYLLSFDIINILQFTKVYSRFRLSSPIFSYHDFTLNCR